APPAISPSLAARSPERSSSGLPGMGRKVGERLRKPGEEGILEERPNRLRLDPADDLVRERVGQETPGRDEIEATAPNVKEGIFIELAHGGSVRALDIVSEDLELWLR